MPSPIWNIAADCTIELIERDIVLMPEEEERLHRYLRDLPVRCLLNLLTFVHNGRETIGDFLHMDSLDVDHIICSESDTPYRDHLMVIFDDIRVAIGKESWFQPNSVVRRYTYLDLRGWRDMESNIGFSPDERSYLINLIYTATAPPQVDDDDAATTSVASSAITEPLENNLGELLDDSRHWNDRRDIPVA